MRQPNQLLALQLQLHQQQSDSMLIPGQEPGPRSDLFSPNLTPFSALHRHEYPQVGRLVRPEPWAHSRWASAGVEEAPSLTAWAGEAVDRSPGALEVEEVQRSLASAVEEVRRSLASAEAEEQP